MIDQSEQARRQDSRVLDRDDGIDPVLADPRGQRCFVALRCAGEERDAAARARVADRRATDRRLRSVPSGMGASLTEKRY
jgi:hypothetical protein